MHRSVAKKLLESSPVVDWIAADNARFVERRFASNQTRWQRGRFFAAESLAIRIESGLGRLHRRVQLRTLANNFFCRLGFNGYSTQRSAQENLHVTYELVDCNATTTSCDAESGRCAAQGGPQCLPATHECADGLILPYVWPNCTKPGSIGGFRFVFLSNLDHRACCFALLFT